jgi:hypothetical protein
MVKRLFPSRGDLITLTSKISFVERILYKGLMVKILEKKFNREKMSFTYKCLVA